MRINVPYTRTHAPNLTYWYGSHYGVCVYRVCVVRPNTSENNRSSLVNNNSTNDVNNILCYICCP